MKVSNFKVGDKVLSNATGKDEAGKDYWHAGREGEVVEGDISNMLLVRFPDYRGTHGHSGIDAHGKKNMQHWYFCDSRGGYDASMDVSDLILVEKASPSVVVKPKSPHGKQEYKGNGKHSWEDSAGGLQRIRVPGGWIYNLYDIDVPNDAGSTQAAVFVPVPSVVGYKV